MKNLAFWKPVIIGIIAAPIFLLVTMNVAGIGHGNYLPIIVFYPISFFLIFFKVATEGIEDAFLKMIVGNGIILLVLGNAIIQFPLYGFIISYSRTKKEPSWFTILETIVWIHIVISAAALPFALLSAVI